MKFGKATSSIGFGYSHIALSKRGSSLLGVCFYVRKRANIRNRYSRALAYRALAWLLHVSLSWLLSLSML